MQQFQLIFFFVWLAAMLVTGWTVEAARMFARRVAKDLRSKEAEKTGGPWPRVAAILPIKGVEPETEQNVRALLRQDYPNYRLLFAVESAVDPVVALLEKIARESPSVPIEIVTAGIATDRGQKIQNQRAAVSKTTDADEVLVFMDADARPRPMWMRELVKPLSVDDVGATTGFRFYIPSGTRDELPNIMLSIINAAVAALLGPGWRNIAWGGSMAIRRDNFLAFGVELAWQNAVSDDYVLSWCVKTKAKKRIQFVQACMVESRADLTWPGLWEFASRQYRITRVCAPWIWLLALAAPILYLVSLAYTLSFWFLTIALGRPDHPLILMFLALYLGNAIRGHFLLQGGLAVAISDESRARLKRAAFWYTLGYPASLAVNLLALLRSACGRTILWRGVTYIMHSRTRTTVRRPSTDGR